MADQVRTLGNFYLEHSYIECSVIIRGLRTLHGGTLSKFKVRRYSMVQEAVVLGSSSRVSSRIFCFWGGGGGGEDCVQR